MPDIDPEGFVRGGEGCFCGPLYTYGGHIEPGQFDPTCSVHGVDDDPRPDVDPDTFTLGLALDEAQEAAANDPLLAVWKRRINPWAEAI